MRKTILLVAALCSELPASAQGLSVDSFAPETLGLVDSNCQFGSQRDTILVSDWDKKFWMKINGKMLSFQSEKNGTEVEAQLKNKRWRETLKADSITLRLDLVETARGDDSAAFQGFVDVQRGSMKKHILIAGGCGA
jgi:hypothetical protein